MLKMSKFKALKQYHYCYKETDWMLAIHIVELPLLKEVRRFSQGLLLSWCSDIVHLNCSTLITVTVLIPNELWSQRLSLSSSNSSLIQLVFFNRQFRCGKTWPTKNLLTSTTLKTYCCNRFCVYYNNWNWIINTLLNVDANGKLGKISNWNFQHL